MTKSFGLPAPTRFLAVAAAGGVDLSWKDEATGETGYVVERRPDGLAGYQVVAQLKADSSSFPDRDGVTTSFSTYRVKAVSDALESPYAYASVFAGPPTGTGVKF